METIAQPAPTRIDQMVWLDGGTFRMGSDRHYREEAPAHTVTVNGFWIDLVPVTNAAFSRFVEATKYLTVAERPANPAEYPGARMEMLLPSSLVFVTQGQRVGLRHPYNWWRYVRGANWRHPLGPQSSIRDLDNHPVVHVAYADARAYCEWARKELPTEAEWEFAARGGHDGKEYAWGDELNPNGQCMANTWQGEFPIENLLEDGFEGTSPVGSFSPNGYGLFDMIGNVWEWTSDWYQEHRHAVASPCCGQLNPKGGEQDKSYDPHLNGLRIARRVMKGGSYLCAPNYSQRYRPAARMAQAIDTSTCHLGFRCIRRKAPI